MICRSCNREIERVLLLSHGRKTTLCPLCKQDPTGNGKLLFTQENEELCRLAENYYYRWLTSEKGKHEEERYLDQAISNAELAAAMGNPRACVRMGFFYDKDYIGLDLGEVQRCRFAYNYYMRVAEHREDFAAENDSLSLDRTSSAELRMRAGRLLLDMLAAAPPELKEIEAYDFYRNRDRLRMKIGLEYDKEEEDVRNAVSKSDQLFRMLSVSCLSRDRAPLLGVYRIHWEDLKALLSRTVGPASEGKLPLVDFLRMQRVEIRCIPCGSDGNAAGDSTFHAIKNSDALQKIEPYVFKKRGNKYDGMVWLYFYNRDGKHLFFGAKELNSIARALENDDHALLRQIITNNRRTDCTLFDDDVYCYADHGLKRALIQLSENIGGIQE